MGDFVTVRKGSTSLHVSYGHGSTNDLYGYNTQIRSDPYFELRIDLTPNLRTQNKQTNTYMDARDLAGGEIARLTMLQIVGDDLILKAVDRSLRRLPTPPETWILTLCLYREWSYIVRPEVKHGSLFLYVEDPVTDSR